MDKIWLQMCEAAGVDAEKRLAARQAVLESAEAVECTVYRPDENDPDAEELDLGEARILFEGPFVTPDDWSEEECEEFFGDDDPEQFVTARIECEAAPSSSAYFLPEIGDYLAAVPGQGEVVMFYVHDCEEDDDGLHCVLIRDDEQLL